jgi:hypothetical protein
MVDSGGASLGITQAQFRTGIEREGYTCSTKGALVTCDYGDTLRAFGSFEKGSGLVRVGYSFYTVPANVCKLTLYDSLVSLYGAPDLVSGIRSFWLVTGTVVVGYSPNYCLLTVGVK